MNTLKHVSDVSCVLQSPHFFLKKRLPKTITTLFLDPTDTDIPEREIDISRHLGLQ